MSESAEQTRLRWPVPLPGACDALLLSVQLLFAPWLAGQGWFHEGEVKFFIDGDKDFPTLDHKAHDHDGPPKRSLDRWHILDPVIFPSRPDGHDSDAEVVAEWQVPTTGRR